jgi:hypothetical protein
VTHSPSITHKPHVSQQQDVLFMTRFVVAVLDMASAPSVAPRAYLRASIAGSRNLCLNAGWSAVLRPARFSRQSALAQTFVCTEEL